MSSPARVSAQVVRWRNGDVDRVADTLAVEEPLEIRVDTRPVSVTMRTPGHDEELALGFLVGEGLVQARDEVAEVRPYPRNADGNVVDVLLRPDVRVDFARLTRHVFASSSCGLCGKATIDAVHGRFPPVRSDLRLAPADLLLLPGRLRAAQETFDLTGGLHAAAVFASDGSLVCLREDVGRHNAVDKVIGHCLRHGPWPLAGHVLLVSGRASFELVQKALAARIPLLAAVSAPSSLAVEFARASGQTLVGFLRDGRFNVYTHPERLGIGLPAAPGPVPGQPGADRSRRSARTDS